MTENVELFHQDHDHNESLGSKRPPMIQMQNLQSGTSSQKRAQRSKQAPMTAPPQLLRPLLIDRTVNAALKRQVSDGRINEVSNE